MDVLFSQSNTSKHSAMINERKTPQQLFQEMSNYHQQQEEPVYTRKRRLSETLLAQQQQQQQVSSSAQSGHNHRSSPARFGGTVSFAENIEQHHRDDEDNGLNSLTASTDIFLSPLSNTSAANANTTGRNFVSDDESPPNPLALHRKNSLEGNTVATAATSSTSRSSSAAFREETRFDATMAPRNHRLGNSVVSSAATLRSGSAQNNIFDFNEKMSSFSSSSAVFTSDAADAFRGDDDDDDNDNDKNNNKKNDNINDNNLVPSSTEAWFEELNDETSDAEEVLFSKLVNQFANTIKFDGSLNLGATSLNLGGASSSSILSNPQQQQTSTKTNPQTDDEHQNTSPRMLRQRSNTFFRKSAIQTRSILLETTKKMDQEANNASREQIESVDFPKRLKQIFKLVIWPELIQRRNRNRNDGYDDDDDFNPVGEFSKDEVRCLWLDFGRVFASEISDGKFFESSSSDDDNDENDDDDDNLNNEDQDSLQENDSEQVSLSNTTSAAPSRSSSKLPVSSNKRTSRSSSQIPKPAPKNTTRKPTNNKKTKKKKSTKKTKKIEEEEETFEQHLMKRQQKLSGSVRSPLLAASAQGVANFFDNEDDIDQEESAEKKRQKIDETIDIIKKLEKWTEVTISKKALTEFSLLSGIEIDGTSSNVKNPSMSPSPDRLTPSVSGNDISAFAQLNASTWFPSHLDGADEEQQQAGSLKFSPAKSGRPPAHLLGQNNNNNMFSPSMSASNFSPNKSVNFAAQHKRRFSFLDVLQWICNDEDLAKHDRHAKLKVRMRAHGCRPLTSKTIESLYSVFGAFDTDGSNELDRDEIGQLFNLMTSAVVQSSPINRDDDDASPNSPMALARRASIMNNSRLLPPLSPDKNQDQDQNNNILNSPPSSPGSPPQQKKRDSSSPFSDRSDNNNPSLNPGSFSIRSGSGDDDHASPGSHFSESFEYKNNSKNSSQNQNQNKTQQQQQQQELSEEDLDLLMEAIDVDGSGTISFEEALLLLASDLDIGFTSSKKKKKENDDSSSSTSSMSDDDNSSDDERNIFSTSGDLRNSSKNKKKSSSGSLLTSPTKRKNKNKKKTSSSSNTTLQGLRDSGLDHKIMQCFRKYDPCRTGFISLPNLRSSILDLAGEHLTLEQIEDILDAADGIRGDGYVNYLQWNSLWECARGESSLKD